MSPCSVELSAALRRQLALSTEDLRLADLLVRAVTEPGPGPGSGSGSGSPADSPSGVGGGGGGGAEGHQPPRGSDAWLREVFRLYLYMLLRTSLLPGEGEIRRRGSGPVRGYLCLESRLLNDY